MTYRLAIAAGVLLVAVPARAQQASFEGLGDLPGGETRSIAYGVSPDGSVVVGRGSVGEGAEAARWEAGAVAGLGDLPGGEARSFAYGASDGGAVVVGFGTGDNAAEAFRWEAGTMDGLGFLPGGGVSEALDVSADGAVVVGISRKTGGTEAFRWEGGEMVGIGGLPNDLGVSLSAAAGVSADGAVVVGQSFSVNGAEAFRWEAGVMEGLGDLGGPEFRSQAFGVSANGEVVVGTSAPAEGDGPTEAFRWQDGEMEGLGDLPGSEAASTAYAASATGSTIVGQGLTEAGGEAFIWRDGLGMENLRDVLASEFGLDLAGWVLTEARGVSDDGRVVVGYGTNPAGEIEAWQAFLGTPVASETAPAAGSLRLSAATPNPARDATTFTLSAGHSLPVTVEVFDAAGRRVATLYSGTLAAGAVVQLSLDAAALTAGIYTVRATSADGVVTRRATVVR